MPNSPKRVRSSAEKNVNTDQKSVPSDQNSRVTPKPAQAKRKSTGVTLPRQTHPITPTEHPPKGKSPKHRTASSAHPSQAAPTEGFDIVLETSIQDELSQQSRTEVSYEDILRSVERKTGMTADDISMIFELGYEHELGRLIGNEALKKLKAEHIRSARSDDRHRFRTALGYRNREYTGEQSRDVILANYVHDKKTLIVRLALTALLALILLPIELSVLFGGAFAHYRETLPFLFPLLGLICVTVAGIFSYKQLAAGLKSFLHFSPTPYSVAALLFPIALLVGCFNLFLTGNSKDLISVNLPTVGALLLTAICDGARLSSEMRVFRILAADEDKTVIEPAEPYKQKLRHGDKIVKIINDDVDQNLYRLRKTARISGFFRRCNDMNSAMRPFGYLLLTVFCLTFLSGFLCAVLGKDFSTVASAALLTFFFSLPLPAVLIFFYPLCRANRQLTHRNCALVGEESVLEYSEPKTVIFHDGDMYAAKKCTQTTVREGEDFRRDMRLAGILFRNMNGALRSTVNETVSDPPVTFVRLGENGTEAVVDNHYHLLAGSAEFLTKSGVRIPKESTDRACMRDQNVSLMYVAIDGFLKLTYEIEYEISQEFERMVSMLADHNTYTAIRTYDPNLNDAFLQAGRPESSDYVRVIKPVKYEPDEVSAVSDCGVVALGKRFNATRPLIAASLIQKLRFYAYRVQFLLSVASIIPAVLLALRHSELLAGVPVLIALLFQGASIAAAWLATRIYTNLQ